MISCKRDFMKYVIFNLRNQQTVMLTNTDEYGADMVKTCGCTALYECFPLTVVSAWLGAGFSSANVCA